MVGRERPEPVLEEIDDHLVDSWAFLQVDITSSIIPRLGGVLQCGTCLLRFLRILPLTWCPRSPILLPFSPRECPSCYVASDGSQP